MEAPGRVDGVPTQALGTSFLDVTKQHVWDERQVPNTAALSDDALAIASYLSRPAIVYQGVWTTSTNEIQITDPIRSLLNLTRVQEKLKYFKLLRFEKLKIRITCTSTNFNYGLAALVYWPFGNATWVPYSYEASDIIPLQYACTLPHVYITPGDGMGGEIDIPWFFPTSAFDIAGNGDTSTFIGANTMYFRTFSQLRAAGGAGTSDVNFTIYAWLEGVKVSIPTPLTIVVSQSMLEHVKKAHGKVHAVLGKLPKKSEFQTMKASSVASTVAGIAGTLSDVPVIGGFAKATEMAADAVGSVLSWFGLSRPLKMDDAARTVLVSHSDLATYNGVDTSAKLALDLKQELTIDPTIIGGTGEDEMALSYLLKKEGLIAKMTWLSTSTPHATVGYIPVSPCCSTVVSVLVGEEYYAVAPTPLCYLTQPFAYWRGTIVYRVVIPVSTFIKGKIRVSYIPQSDGTTFSGTDLSQTTTNVVIDLATTTEAEIEIPWCQASEWGQRRGTIFTDATGAFLKPALNLERNYAKNVNGLLVFHVIDPLVGPAATCDCDILVFQRAGDDFRVNKIDTSDLQRNFANTQVNSLVRAFNYRDAVPQSIASFPKHEESKQLGLLTFGEEILSIRQVLKRYYELFLLQTRLGSAGTVEAISYIFPIYPVDYYSYYTSSSAGRPMFNLVDPMGDGSVTTRMMQRNTPFNHYRSCFLAVRGGMRYKGMSTNTAAHTTSDLNNNVNTLSVASSDMYSERSGQPYAIAPSYAIDGRSFFVRVNYLPNDGGIPIEPSDIGYSAISDFGAVINRTENKLMVEAEIPFYSQYLYLQGDSDGGAEFVENHDETTISPTTEVNRVEYRLVNMGRTSLPTTRIYQSTAEDFSFMFFLYAPMHYEEWATCSTTTVTNDDRRPFRYRSNNTLWSALV